MNKDVIYIDVDDDVTAIIGKIKDAKEKVVALVPPKRAGALQSAVNLRLLERMAKNSKKSLVLVTNNQALVALAASAHIPVAKNLQSKPELAEIPALIVDGDDDIIDGADLPVGELVKTASVSASSASSASTPEKSNMRHQAIDEIAYTGGDSGDEGDLTVVSALPVTPRRASKSISNKKGGAKVPSFDKFRKKLVFIILGIGGLAALLVWMFVFAPSATVIVTAGASPQPVSSTIKLGGVAATDFKTGVVSSVSKQEKKDTVVDFEATGQKDLGEKAKGSVRFSTSSLGGLGTIPAGTKLTSSSGLVFVTDNSVTLAVQSLPVTLLSGTTTVTAEDSGENYNAATGSLTGAPASVSAAFTAPTSGGTTKVVKVVSAEDIERAKGQVAGKSSDEEKKALIKKFTNNEIVIDSSFVVDRAEPVISPALGQEATDGKAKLTVSTTYTIQAVAKSELDSYLKSAIGSKIDNDSQKIYETGVDGASLSSFKKDGDTMTVSVTASGSVGPKIDEADIKDQVKGERYGEVQQRLQLIDGVKDVDVKFPYFWVRTIPNNVDKISIEFKLENE